MFGIYNLVKVSSLLIYSPLSPLWRGVEGGKCQVNRWVIGWWGNLVDIRSHPRPHPPHMMHFAATLLEKNFNT